MSQTTTVTNYSGYTPFADGNNGVRAHSSALGQMFPDINDLQTDMLEFLGALKDLADGTDPTNFLNNGWGGSSGLPDATIVPVIYVTEGSNLWLAPNNPVDFNLTLSTTWVNVYAGQTYNAANYRRTAGNYTTTSTSLVDVDPTNMALTIVKNSGKDIQISLVGRASHSNTNGNWFAIDLDNGTETREFLEVNANTTGYVDNVSFNYIWTGLSTGSHTFKLQFRQGAGGTTTLYNGCVFDVREIPGEA